MDIYTSIENSIKDRDQKAIFYKKQGKTFSLTYNELFDLVGAFSLSLKRFGISKGDALGIMMPNCLEWMITDLAGLKLGAKVISIPSNIPKDIAEYIVADSKAKLLVTDKDDFAKVKVIKLENFKSYLQTKGDIERKKIKDNDIATICYTSGSAGLPKGVILTHKNILSNVLAQPFSVNEKDLFLSYLPLCHIFERTCGYYTPLLNSAAIAICEDHTKVLDYAAEFKPTLMLTVPRVIEKINNKLEEDPKGKILAKIPILKKLVGKKLKKKLGGRIRFLVSGSAPLGKEMAERFWGLGLKIYEGYGMTECSPTISTNSEKNFRLGSVGKVIKGVKVKFLKDEIYVKSPGLMQGYTDKRLTRGKIVNGWFKTGDLGFIDKDGFLFINGRADTWIVMSIGKKAFPEPIEKKLVQIPGVEQACVFGNNKPFLTALIYGEVDKEVLGKEIERVNKELFKHEMIGKFAFISEPFTAENGLLTHTLKPKREKIYQKYKKVIVGLYKK